MVFRKVRTAAGEVSRSEWLLIAVEGVLVFISIFGAFQLQQWADNQREAKEQRQLLERLAEESEQTVASIREQRDVFADIADRQFAALDRWVNSSSCPTEAGWSALSKAGFYPALSYPTAAYDEMVGSGGLSRLPTADVRQTVSAFHATVRSYERQQDFFRQASIASSIGEEDDPTARVRVNRERKAIGMETDDKRACSDPKAIRQSAYGARNFRVMQGWRERVAAKAIQMCVSINAALGKECHPSEGGPLSAEDKAIGAKRSD